jgi:uncharacterized SAM-binding protein YcdF (DUF218 family)
VCPGVRCTWPRCVGLWVGCTLAASLLLWVTAGWWLPAIGHWLAVPSRPGQADAVVVLGGSGPRAIQHGIELYRQTQAGELWYTGDNPTSGVPLLSYGESFVRFAVQQGVPAESIHLLATTSTWEDGQAIADLARQRRVRTLVIVTNWFHSRRALCVIQRQLDNSGIGLYYDPPHGLYGPDDWWQQEDGLVAVVNELIKLVFYWRCYGLPFWHC